MAGWRARAALPLPAHGSRRVTRRVFEHTGRRDRSRWEVVRASVFGYPGGVTARSPLETLKELRQQVHEAERARLVAEATLEHAAETEKERARQRLAAAEAASAAARRREDERLAARGITAAEGQLRVHWENAERRRRARLGDEHERAVQSHRAAVERHDQARVALSQADAELRVVQERLDQRARLRQRGEELAQQEVIDESSLRRFQERNGA